MTAQALPEAWRAYVRRCVRRRDELAPRVVAGSGISPDRNVSAAMRISEVKPVEGGHVRIRFDGTNLYEQRDTP